MAVSLIFGQFKLFLLVAHSGQRGCVCVCSDTIVRRIQEQAEVRVSIVWLLFTLTSVYHRRMGCHELLVEYSKILSSTF